MRRALLLLALFSPVALADDLAPLSDEFDRREEIGDWKLFHATYGWPDKIKALDIGKTTDGALHLQPHDSAWVRDLVAPFLYRELTGDFDVRARVRVRGADGPVPGGIWSLGGLLARVPNQNSEANWAPFRENWNFITTGVGHVAGETMTETKATVNSYSSLKLRPFASGWVELRLVRVGMAIIALARADGDSRWQVRDRFYRMDQRPDMQVGLIAYTTNPDQPRVPENPAVLNREVKRDVPVDMILEVDWIRFARPALRAVPDWYAQVSANPLADVNLAEAEVLALIGD